MNLNENEIEVLEAVIKCAIDCTGGSFAYTDEIIEHLPEDYDYTILRGYLSQLSQKGYTWKDSGQTGLNRSTLDYFPQYKDELIF